MAPEIGYTHDDAFDEGDLQVSELHRIHYSQYGKRDGKPGESKASTWQNALSEGANASQSSSSTADQVVVVVKKPTRSSSTPQCTTSYS
jgi:hypothetical protein